MIIKISAIFDQGGADDIMIRLKRSEEDPGLAEEALMERVTMRG
jgi:hypothetical protein